MSRKRAHKQIIDFTAAKDIAIKSDKRRQVTIIPKNIAQELYVNYLNNCNTRITFAIGPAGTGKTYLAVLHSVKLLQNKQIDKIIITRPAVSVDEQHGFLPGDLNKKMEPWTRPIFDVFEEYWSTEQIENMIEDRVIEISPLAYMRGRTFKYCHIVADEMQNATPEQMKMLLTRIGNGTTMSVTGDLEQHDRGYEKNGLKDFINRLDDDVTGGISVCRFTKDHVERDPIVTEILSLYEH